MLKTVLSGFAQMKLPVTFASGSANSCITVLPDVTAFVNAFVTDLQIASLRINFPLFGPIAENFSC